MPTGPVSGDELLNPKAIRDWAQVASKPRSRQSEIQQLEIGADPVAERRALLGARTRVIPIEVGKEIIWVDDAGFAVAKSDLPSVWEASYRETYDFDFLLGRRQVVAHPYM